MLDLPLLLQTSDMITIDHLLEDYLEEEEINSKQNVKNVERKEFIKKKLNFLNLNFSLKKKFIFKYLYIICTVLYFPLKKDLLTMDFIKLFLLFSSSQT